METKNTTNNIMGLLLIHCLFNINIIIIKILLKMVVTIDRSKKRLGFGNRSRPTVKPIYYTAQNGAVVVSSAATATNDDSNTSTTTTRVVSAEQVAKEEVARATASILKLGKEKEQLTMQIDYLSTRLDEQTLETQRLHCDLQQQERKRNETLRAEQQARAAIVQQLTMEMCEFKQESARAMEQLQQEKQRAMDQLKQENARMFEKLKQVNARVIASLKEENARLRRREMRQRSSLEQASSPDSQCASSPTTPRRQQQQHGCSGCSDEASWVEDLGILLMQQQQQRTTNSQTAARGGSTASSSVSSTRTSVLERLCSPQSRTANRIHKQQQQLKQLSPRHIQTSPLSRQYCPSSVLHHQPTSPSVSFFSVATPKKQHYTTPLLLTKTDNPDTIATASKNPFAMLANNKRKRLAL
jgi:hypothetical protein